MPAINEQHTIILKVLANLMRRNFTASEQFLISSPSPRFDLNPQIITSSTTMTSHRARFEMLNIVTGVELVESHIQLVGQELVDNKIKGSLISLILHNVFLTRVDILTDVLKFDIDAALKLMHELPKEEFEYLPEVLSVPFAQFNALFNLLYEAHHYYPYYTALNKILAIVEVVDAQLKPWHIRSLFNSTLLAHQLTSERHRKAALIEDERGADQCNRNAIRLAQREYPQAFKAFTIALRYTPAEANNLISLISQYNVDNVDIVLRTDMRRLIRECIYMAKAYNTTTKVVHNDISNIKNGLPSRFDQNPAYVARIQDFNVPIWIADSISPALFKLMDEVIDRVDNSPPSSELYFDTVDELFSAYDLSLLPTFEPLICMQIYSDVSQAKLPLYKSAQIYKILANDIFIPSLMLSNIETSIAIDYLSCGVNYYDYEHTSVLYFILKNYEGHHQFALTQVAAIPTRILMPIELENELNIADLTGRLQKTSPHTYFATQFAHYVNKEQKFEVQNNKEHKSAAGRRLFVAGLTKPVDDTAEVGQSPGFLSNLFYRFFGKPLLNIIKESPTYFPTNQPNLWSGTGINNRGNYHPVPIKDNVTPLLNTGVFNRLGR